MTEVKKGIVAKISVDGIVTVQPPDGGPFDYKIPKSFFECKIVIGMKVDIITSKDCTDVKVVASPNEPLKKEERFKGTIMDVDDDGVHIKLDSGKDAILPLEYFECEITLKRPIYVVFSYDEDGDRSVKVISQGTLLAQVKEHIRTSPEYEGVRETLDIIEQQIKECEEYEGVRETLDRIEQQIKECDEDDEDDDEERVIH